MAKAKKPNLPQAEVPRKPIKYHADFQINWAGAISPLKRGHFAVVAREMHGDAPKDFLRVRETDGPNPSRADRPASWPAHIAKVGSKWYPVESITEHLITRIGQCCAVQIADSRLVFVGGQVRFLSRYFLDDSCERLTHGLDLFRRVLDEETVEAIAKGRRERQEYTFQVVETLLRLFFPAHHAQLWRDFVSLLCFDAFVGNNDRHPMNWGVIIPVGKRGQIRFAPIYDSARGLFWNVDETTVKRMLQNEVQLRAYIGKSQPQIGWNDWDGKGKFDHFALIGLIISSYPHAASLLEPFLLPDLLARCEEAIEREFSSLLSNERRRLIVHCLRLRQQQLALLLPTPSRSAR